MDLKYNRNEYFRYSFEKPCDATFRLIKQQEGNVGVELSNKGVCKILDISPHGLKLFSELFISIEQLHYVELQFTLDTNPISMVGEFIWAQRKADGYEYGVKLVGDSESEKMIISELKSRRRKEMELKK